MALANLLVRIGVDTAAFTSGLERFSTSASAASTAVAGSLDAATAKIATSSTVAAEALAKQKNELRKIGQQYSSGAISAQEFLKAAGNSLDLSKSATETARLNAEIGKLTTQFERGRIGVAQYHARLGQLAQAQNEAAETAEKAKNKIADFGKIGESLRSLGVGFTASVTAPLVALGVGATKAFAEIDSLKRGLSTLEKTAEGTERRFRELEAVAKLPGLGLEEAVRGDIRLRAIGLSADVSLRALLGFGNALASVGSGKADLDETIRQFGQLATASTLTAENLKPIIERVPQAAGILRDAFGTSNAEKLREMGVTSEQVVKALLEGLERLPKVTGGIKNALENLSDDTKKALAAAGAAFEPFVENAINQLAKLVSYIPNLVQEFQKLPDWGQKAGAGVAAVGFVGPLAIVAIGTVIGNIMQIVTAYRALNEALVGVGGVAGAVSIALRAVPFVGLAAGIYLGVDALLATKTATDNVVRAQEQLKASTQEVIDKNREAIASQISYGGVVEVTGAKTRDFISRVFSVGKALEDVKPKIDNTAKAHVAAALGTAAHRRELEKYNVEAQRQNIVEAERAESIRRNAQSIRQFELGLNPRVDASQILEQINRLKSGVLGFTAPIELVPVTKELESPNADLQRALTVVSNSDAVKRNVENIKGIGKAYKDAGGVAKRSMQEVSTVLTNLSQGIGQAIFSGEKFGAVFVRIGKQIGASITSFIIQELLRASGVLDAFSRTLSGVIKNVTGQAVQQGTGAVISNLPDTVSGNIPNLPPPGGAPGAPSAAGSIASASLTGIVGAVGGLVSAVSGVISNFQFAAMNKSLDIIVKHTLQTANDLANLRDDEFKRKDELFSKLDSLFQFSWVKLDEVITSVRAIGTLPFNGAVAGGGSVNNFSLSAFVAPGGEAQFFDWFATELRRRRLIP